MDDPWGLYIHVYTGLTAKKGTLKKVQALWVRSQHWAMLAMINSTKEFSQNTTVVQSEHAEHYSKALMTDLWNVWDNIWGILSTSDSNPRCYMHLWCRFLLVLFSKHCFETYAISSRLILKAIQFSFKRQPILLHWISLKYTLWKGGLQRKWSQTFAIG